MQIRYYCFFIIAVVAIILGACKNDAPVVPPGSKAQYALADFSPSQACSTCHPQQYNEWSGSMHRYSTSDPIWMLANNSLHASTGGKLETWCFQCHAPIGFLTDNVKAPFQFADLNPLVREGINCDFCHVLRPPYETTNQHVRYSLTPGKIKYGTLVDPVGNSFHENRYDGSYATSDYCRPCHDLIVNNVPLEITNTEWQNSPWGAMSVECQNCHMQTYTGSAAVGGPVRNNLHRHDFIGVDVAITDFPNRPEQKEAITSLLRNSATMSLVTPTSGVAGDSAEIAVLVHNDKTGHNLPTSVFFNRQMWIEVTVWNGTDTIYRSGNFDTNGDLMDKNSALRPGEDRDLVIFNGAMYKNGAETNVFELDSVWNNSIPPFATRRATYNVRINNPGIWNVRARLLFRPFGPYLFRSLNAGEYVSELPVFEMASDEKFVTVH